MRLFSILLTIAIAHSTISADADEKKPKKEDRLPAKKTPEAPETYQVKFETSQGDVILDITRKWAPLGADRFHEAVTKGFYDECRFFRVLPGFVVQFGINGAPDIQQHWREAQIKDDKVKESNVEGTLTFATAGPDTRTTQMFINFGDNSGLDRMGFAPIGKVSKGMDIVKKINAEYRQRPDQRYIQQEGNAYLKKEFPRLDYIKKATIVKPKKKKEDDKK
ncbi:MAG: peptidylprolyl isomerase [Planctomycetaceae bacterium]|nr:peptidylprolyl isomerase [Planctomycetaceae bacterium]